MGGQANQQPVDDQAIQDGQQSDGSDSEDEDELDERDDLDEVELILQLARRFERLALQRGRVLLPPEQFLCAIYDQEQIQRTRRSEDAFDDDLLVLVEEGEQFPDVPDETLAYPTR